jgi:hypothetical protein
MNTDFHFTNHGSVTILTPVSSAAQEWAAEHLPEDAMRWAGGIVIEPRYLGDILDGITNDGLTVGGAA